VGVTKRRHSKEELARRGDVIFERDVRPNLRPTDQGRYVAIDIESGTYELADEELAACDRLWARIPGAQIWMVRVGSRAVRSFGAGRRADT